MTREATPDVPAKTEEGPSGEDSETVSREDQPTSSSAASLGDEQHREDESKTPEATEERATPAERSRSDSLQGKKLVGWPILFWSEKEKWLWLTSNGRGRATVEIKFAA